MKEFKTLKDLALFYNIIVEELDQSINIFNQTIEMGEDKYFNKQILEKAGKIDKPPFYGIRLWPKVHHTMGGIKINTKGQVIDVNNKAIENLYAVGEITGGVHGASRLGSSAITECLVFGRIAGKNIASNLAFL